MIIAVLIGAIATILALKGCDEDALLIITILNSIITILIGIISIFKFDVKGETYLHISNGYNKLEMYIENATSQLELINNNIDKKKFYFKQIKIIEENICNLKEDDNYTIPNIVYLIYPILSKINIFKFIKLNNVSFSYSNEDEYKKLAEQQKYCIEGQFCLEEPNLLLLEKELIDELQNGDKYKSIWFIFYIYNPNKRNIHNEFIN
jgi:hypothetical protein